MAGSINDVLVQLKAIELMAEDPTFLWDMLVDDKGAVNEGEVIWDFRKGALDNLAPFVAEDVGGVTMERDGFETRSIKFPTLAPQRIVEKDMIMQRGFGEVVYGGKTPEQRARELVAKDLKFLKRAITFRLEWMVAELLTTGKLTLPTYTQDGVLKSSQVADFKFTNSAAATVKWDQPTADIYADLIDMYDQVVDGLGTVDAMIMAPDVAAAMLNNEAFLKKYDIRSLNVGSLAPKYVKAPGVRYMGVTSDGVELYSYSRKYVGEDGQVKPFIPAKHIYSVSKKMFRAYFGPVTLIEREGAPFRTYVAREVPFRNSYPGSNTEVQRVYSRPVIMPYNVDGWAARTVLS